MNKKALIITLTIDGYKLIPNYADGAAFDLPQAEREAIAKALELMAGQLRQHRNLKSD